MLEQFTKADVNKDGAVTHEEAFANVAASSKDEKSDADHRAGMQNRRRGAFGGWRGPRADRGAFLDAIFARSDSNKDGKLTKDEVADPIWQRIAKADANNDGAVTKEEMTAQRATADKSKQDAKGTQPATPETQPKEPAKAAEPSTSKAPKDKPKEEPKKEAPAGNTSSDAGPQVKPDANTDQPKVETPTSPSE